MKRILYIGLESGEGDAPHQSMILERLAAWNHQVVALWPEPPSAAIKQWTEQDYVVPSGRASIYRWTRAILKHADGVDAIYVQGVPSVERSIVARRILRGVRWIYHTQDFYEPHIHPLRSRLEGQFARNAGLVIVNHAARGRVLQSIHRLKATPCTIPTALPLSWPAVDRAAIRKYHAQWSTSDQAGGERYIIVGGPLGPNRCGGLVLDALQRLGPRYRAICTGGSPKELITGGSNQPSAGGNQPVVVLPRLPFQELLTVFAAGHVGLLLYPNDGIGNFFQMPGRYSEYAFSGIPNVCSPSTSLENLVHRDGTGEAVEALDANLLAGAIQRQAERGADDLERTRIQAKFYSSIAYELGAASFKATLERFLDE